MRRSPFGSFVSVNLTVGGVIAERETPIAIATTRAAIGRCGRLRCIEDLLGSGLDYSQPARLGGRYRCCRRCLASCAAAIRPAAAYTRLVVPANILSTLRHSAITPIPTNTP